MISVNLTFDGSEVKRAIIGGNTIGGNIKSESRMPLKCDESTVGVYSDGEYYTVTIKRHRKNDYEWDDLIK